MQPRLGPKHRLRVISHSRLGVGRAGKQSDWRMYRSSSEGGAHGPESWSILWGGSLNLSSDLCVWARKRSTPHTPPTHTFVSVQPYYCITAISWSKRDKRPHAPSPTGRTTIPQRRGKTQALTQDSPRLSSSRSSDLLLGRVWKSKSLQMWSVWAWLLLVVTGGLHLIRQWWRRPGGAAHQLHCDDEEEELKQSPEGLKSSVTAAVQSQGFRTSIVSSH